MANCDNAYIVSQTTMLGGIYCCSSLYAWLSNSINGAQPPSRSFCCLIMRVIETRVQVFVPTGEELRR